jgi:hypothetical protein
MWVDESRVQPQERLSCGTKVAVDGKVYLMRCIERHYFGKNQIRGLLAEGTSSTDHAMRKQVAAMQRQVVVIGRTRAMENVVRWADAHRWCLH